MKRLSLALVILLVSLSAFAVDAPKTQLFALYEEVANPAMIPQYEAATKDLVKALAEKKVASPSFAFTTFMSTDMHYFYLSPIRNHGDIDAMDRDWMNGGEFVGKERWADIMKRADAAMMSYDAVVVARRDDLSYTPEHPRVNPMTAPYARLQYFYLKPGTEMEAEQIARDYASLFKSKNIPESFAIYMAMSGHDLPLLVAVIPANSASDYASADEKTNAALGDALRALQGRALSITRHFEQKELWARPDLSYMPPVTK